MHYHIIIVLPLLSNYKGVHAVVAALDCIELELCSHRVQPKWHQRELVGAMCWHKEGGANPTVTTHPFAK
jgi:hypothetical protein